MLLGLVRLQAMYWTVFIESSFTLHPRMAFVFFSMYELMHHQGPSCVCTDMFFTVLSLWLRKLAAWTEEPIFASDVVSQACRPMAVSLRALQPSTPRTGGGIYWASAQPEIQGLALSHFPSSVSISALCSVGGRMECRGPEQLLWPNDICILNSS